MAHQRLLRLAVRLRVWPLTRLARGIAEAIMHESCDRCGPGVRALYRATRGELALTLCGRHARLLGDVLRDSGWMVLPVRIPLASRTLDRAGV